MKAVLLLFFATFAFVIGAWSRPISRGRKARAASSDLRQPGTGFSPFFPLAGRGSPHRLTTHAG
jgi:hypothetical protein